MRDHTIIENMERTGYPDGREPRRVDRCLVCVEDIYEGQEYYDFDGDMVCPDCLVEYEERKKKR